MRGDGKVRVGDPAPDFTLRDQAGKPVQLRNLLGQGTVVLYFYPKDETPGCTLEARAFRDSYDRFTAAGAEVVGISSDSIASHRRVAARHRVPFLLLSDRGGGVRELYGVDKKLGFLPRPERYVCVAEMVLWLDVLSLVDEPSPQLIVYDHGPSLSGSLNVACSVQSRPTSTVASDPALTVGGWLGWLTVTLCDVVPVAP